LEVVVGRGPGVGRVEADIYGKVIVFFHVCWAVSYTTVKGGLETYSAL